MSEDMRAVVAHDEAELILVARHAEEWDELHTEMRRRVGLPPALIAPLVTQQVRDGQEAKIKAKD